MTRLTFIDSIVLLACSGLKNSRVTGGPRTLSSIPLRINSAFCGTWNVKFFYWGTLTHNIQKGAQWVLHSQNQMKGLTWNCKWLVYLLMLLKENTSCNQRKSSDATTTRYITDYDIDSMKRSLQMYQRFDQTWPQLKLPLKIWTYLACAISLGRGADIMIKCYYLGTSNFSRVRA